MVRTVHQRRFQPHQRVPCQHTVGHCFLQPFFYRREIVFRHRAAKYLFFKYQPFAVGGLKLNPHVAKLPVPAGLLFVPALLFHLFPQAFTVGDPGLRQLHFHAKLRFQLADHHVKVLFAKPGDHLLHRLGIHLIAQRAILFHQPRKRTGNFALVALLLQLQRHRIGRVREGRRRHFKQLARRT
ncbi:hypothetical protein SDC9_182951 [bioreactor metagenome]|uniref:Uncharacterized protein n=1 Tax=bioreactor metagenome TaxID=1076179 RepID=A0A645HIF7_9ZZZZ